MTIDPTPALRLLAADRAASLARMDAVAAQARVLRRILARAAGTRFGRAHGFAAIDGADAFRRAVPLRDWDAFWRDWWQAAFPVLENVSWPGRIPFFAETSGTTGGRTKHIPVSWSQVRANRRAALDIALNHIHRHPGARLFGGPSLILGGSTALRALPGGARAGDLSGIAAATVPFYARTRALPSRSTALEPDWDRKLDRVVAECAGRDLRSVSGTTSWLLILLERLRDATGRDRVLDAFPSLELVIHGGVGLAPYRARFDVVLEGVARTEVFPASEGFFAYADRADAAALRLLVDNGIFYEFVPVTELGAAEPTRLGIDAVELGVDYALAVTTSAGLFAYLVGDVVRFVDRAPPRIVVAGRTAQTLSFFGEHVTGGELDRAMAAAAGAAGIAIGEYTVSIVPPDERDARGGHLFVVETVDAPDPARLADLLDRALAAGNDDYRAHRAGDGGMRPPALRLVPPGTFERWLRARGRVGGQVKVPRVLSDPAEAERLMAFGRAG